MNALHDPVRAAQQLLNAGGVELYQGLPVAVEEILDGGAWAGRRSAAGVAFKDFREFVEHKQWQGLGIEWSDLLSFCRRRTDITKKLLASVAAVAGHGVNQHSGGHDNVRSTDDEYGNAATYALRRLKRDRPDLAEQVITGMLSANAAAIQAGFRKRMVSVPATDLPAAMRLLAKYYRPEDMAIEAARLRPGWQGKLDA